MKKRGLDTKEKGARIFYTERREREIKNKQGQKGREILDRNTKFKSLACTVLRSGLYRLVSVQKEIKKHK